MGDVDSEQGGVTRAGPPSGGPVRHVQSGRTASFPVPVLRTSTTGGTKPFFVAEGVGEGAFFPQPDSGSAVGWPARPCLRPPPFGRPSRPVARPTRAKDSSESFRTSSSSINLNTSTARAHLSQPLAPVIRVVVPTGLDPRPGAAPLPRCAGPRPTQGPRACDAPPRAAPFPSPARPSLPRP